MKEAETPEWTFPLELKSVVPRILFAPRDNGIMSPEETVIALLIQACEDVLKRHTAHYTSVGGMLSSTGGNMAAALLYMEACVLLAKGKMP